MIDLNSYHHIITAKELQSRVLFKDSHVMVINKPVGITVHAGYRGADSLEDYFEHLMFERHEIPQLAHRLDRDTSGCLILSRRKSARSKLGKLFESKSIKKTYWAIVEGSPKEDSGVIDSYLKKVKNEKGWHVKICKKTDEKAKHSITHWTVKKRFDNLTWLELKPKTGRTHQLRIHCQSIGHPILGDSLYGLNYKDDKKHPLLHLHARNIQIPFHHDEKPIFVEAPLPEHMADKIDLG